MTPMMEQYFAIKEQYPGYLLFYRLGDFYEMFFDDAKTASRELDLTLTGRDCGEAERAPMCGVPYHSAEGYIGRLIEKGYKVAICEQVEDPAQAKGLVRREVIRVITPGTLIETGLLSEQRNNYLCAVFLDEDEVGIGFADVSTGQISATSFAASGDSRICNELGTYSPSEVICNLDISQMGEVADFVRGRLGAALGDGQAARFDYTDARRLVERQFAEILREGVLESRAIVSAVGALLSYIAETQKIDIAYIKELNLYRDGQYLEMDLSTRRNLELTETMRAKEKKGSLLWVLDRTRTAPGARMIRQWIEHPLLSVSAILTRQGAVNELHGNYMLREELSELLGNVLDLERLVTKIVYGTANAKDLRAVAATAAVLPEVKNLLFACTDPELCRIRDELDLLEDICDLINSSIVEDPPFSVREGGMIAAGYNADVDYLRTVMHDGRSWIERIEAEEREATGIKNLRINYNKVFGYYIEVTKSMIGMVPDRYTRKQTLTNCERYITQELKDMEATILGAADKVCSLEYEIFCEVRNTVAAAADRLQKSAQLLAMLDVYFSLATVAARNQYVCPEVDCSDVIEIKDGRHPVVEQFVKDSYFVPNDTTLDTGHNRMMLITGPNMAGKSTYMRQTALIVVMAQIGSFVPAADARVGIVDKLF
ncbi:MAG: DNA mismatch repair protein MutS, partial [Clostridia bacterium]|nr:DNA mismatch repair protein MutS [Clostridia bacterium]